MWEDVPLWGILFSVKMCMPWGAIFTLGWSAKLVYGYFSVVWSDGRTDQPC